MSGRALSAALFVLSLLAAPAARGGIGYAGGGQGKDVQYDGGKGTPNCEERVLSKTYLEKRSPSKMNSTDGVWSGTKDDLIAIAKYAESQYGFENTKHLGRNATMLVPATKQEMEWVIGQGGLWKKDLASVYHQDDRYKPWKWNKEKYINARTGSEVVYDGSTGRILLDEKMGTKNFGTPGWIAVTPWGKHNKWDMSPHDEKAESSDELSRNGDQYKYVGILFEHDPIDPNVYYIVDGQTGRRMTNRQVLELPTTMSDMWKNMGLACVKNDATNMIEPKENQDQSDLHALDLDNPNGDWCKCNPPECRAQTIGTYGFVQFQCSKCGKVNVEYAKRAIAFEKKLKAQGIDGHWTGDRSAAVKAASGGR